jgi:hypothetical protein
MWLILLCVAGDPLPQELQSALKKVQGELAKYSHAQHVSG